MFTCSYSHRMLLIWHTNYMRIFRIQLQFHINAHIFRVRCKMLFIYLPALSAVLPIYLQPSDCLESREPAIVCREANRRDGSYCSRYTECHNFNFLIDEIYDKLILMLFKVAYIENTPLNPPPLNPSNTNIDEIIVSCSAKL